MNTLVNFELAKLLKEKGFDVKVRGRIHVSHWHLVKDNIIPSNVNIYYTDIFAPLGNWNDGIQHFMSIPTIAEVVMWLYEKHGIWIEVKKCNYYSFDYKIINGNENLMFKKTPLHRNLKSPTETYEVAIEDAIENLI